MVIENGTQRHPFFGVVVLQIIVTLVTPLSPSKRVIVSVVAKRGPLELKDGLFLEESRFGLTYVVGVPLRVFSGGIAQPLNS